MKPANDDDWLLIGRIRAAHGVRGELAVEPMTDFPHRFAELESVYLGADRREFRVSAARTHSRIFLTLDGVTSRETAQTLRGREIWIPRDEAMELPEGEYYALELIGLSVETVAGEPLGVVADLISTGANDVYVVRSGGRELLVPAIQDVVKEIDISAGRMVVELMPGLIDE